MKLKKSTGDFWEGLFTILSLGLLIGFCWNYKQYVCMYVCIFNCNVSLRETIWIKLNTAQSEIRSKCVFTWTQTKSFFWNVRAVLEKENKLKIKMRKTHKINIEDM